MGKHVRKLLSDQEVMEILERYSIQEIDLSIALRLLKIKRRRFFDLLKRYRENPDIFTLAYQRKQATNKLPQEVERKILQELKLEKKLIENRKNPVSCYNYSYIKNTIEQKHSIEVSLSTIIRRAKKMGIISTNKTKRHTIERY